MSYHIGQIVQGVVTGIQPYGAFIRLDDQTQGLVHISEFKSGIVKNLKDELRVGDLVEVVVLDIDQYNNKISLSIRQLQMFPLRDLPIIKNTNIRRHFWTNHHLNLGFTSIAQQKDEWIQEALNRI